MKKCACCGRTGLLLKLDSNGLCSQCKNDNEQILPDDSMKIADRLATGSYTQLRLVQNSLNAQERINQRQLKSFEYILKKYQQAREYERAGLTDKALNIYISLIALHPEGTDYYTRPCIILEKRKDYQTALEICEIALSEAASGKFGGDSYQEFEKRIARLRKKIETTKH